MKKNNEIAELKALLEEVLKKIEENKAYEKIYVPYDRGIVPYYPPIQPIYIPPVYPQPIYPIYPQWTCSSGNNMCNC